MRTMIKIGSRSQVLPEGPHSMECVSPKASHLLRWHTLFYGVSLSVNLSYLSVCLLPNFFCMRNKESELQEVLTQVSLAPRVLTAPLAGTSGLHSWEMPRSTLQLRGPGAGTPPATQTPGARWRRQATRGDARRTAGAPVGSGRAPVGSGRAEARQTRELFPLS